MKQHKEISDQAITHTTEILGAKIMTVGGDITFWAVKLAPEHIVGGGTDELCYCGNLKIEGGMVAFLEAVNAWAAMDCPLLSDMQETFYSGMRKWAKACHSENLFLLERDKVKAI